jgi:hypothetical protein
MSNHFHEVIGLCFGRAVGIPASHDFAFPLNPSSIAATHNVVTLSAGNEVETGSQLKQNLMGSENCEPTLETVPAKAPPGTSYCGLSFPRSWGRFLALTGRHPRPVFLCSFVHRRIFCGSRSFPLGSARLRFSRPPLPGSVRRAARRLGSLDIRRGRHYL